MKNYLKLMVIGLFLLGAVSSCEDKFTEEDSLNAQTEIERLRDSLKKAGGIVNYTIHIINGTDASVGSKAGNGLAGASVTISQWGIVKTETTNEQGMVVFPDLRIGKVAVDVNLDGYTPMSFIASLSPEGEDGYNFNGEEGMRNAATQVPIFALTGESTSTVKGKVTIDSDLTNNSPEPAANVNVAMVLNTDDPQFTGMFNNQTGDNGMGQIISMTYGSAVMRATTDANGDYTITVPTTAKGLPFRPEIDDIALEQSLLANKVDDEEVTGVQKIRTIYSITQQITGVSSVPMVLPAYVVFGEPSGAAAAEPTNTAFASAVLSQGEIESIVINNAGDGYTQAPKVNITDPTGTGATAVATIANGYITKVEVTSAGKNYTNPTISFEDLGKNAAATAEVAYGVKSISVNNSGFGYTKAPIVTIKNTDGYGTGATATPVMNGSIKKINVTATGSGFSTLPTVSIIGGNGTGAKASAILGAGQITTITVPADADRWYFVAPTVNLPNGATADATLKAGGRITSVNITTGGSGYVSAPTVIISGGGGSGASAYATINGGTVVGITVVNGGNGYTSAPTVTISGGGGSGATATIDPVTIQKQISSVTVTNGGSGFNYSVNYSNQINFDGFTISGTSYTLNCPLTAIAVTNSGSGFTSTPVVQISGGNGSGAAATAEVQYRVEAITVNEPGSGYLSTPQVIITGDGMETSNAQASASLGYGKLNRLVLTNPGQGYSAAPLVILQGGGGSASQARVVAIVENEKVTGFTIEEEGMNYTSAPSVFMVTKLSSASSYAIFKTGTVSAINILNPGAGYTATPVVEFTSTDGFGSGAAATAVVGDGGKIVRIDITNGGTGYTSAPNVRLVIPQRTQIAKGTVTLNDQGSITGITITDGGEGYTSVPEVTIVPAINGAGSGAKAKANIAAGKVISVTLIDGGKGYVSKNFPATTHATTPGSAISGKFPEFKGGVFTVKPGTASVVDFYMGTGVRTQKVD